jgi:hypothetical protein
MREHSTKEGSNMLFIPKIVGLMSCGFVLCLSVSSQAIERMPNDPCGDRKGGQSDLTKCNEEALRGIDTVKGELLRVENESYFVKKTDGKEVVLHVDGTTQMYDHIRPGDNIEAKFRTNTVEDKKHTISMRQLP